MMVQNKPLPLKQRTSSTDSRRDFHQVQTWWSLKGLLKFREYFATVDQFPIWRRHLSWALTDGGDLKGYLTQRFSSSMVFMSLILGTELQVLFNSAKITTEIREALEVQDHSLKFFVGIAIIISIFSTIFSLISVFTSWSMVSAISDNNAHCILRSSIGQLVVELPGKFIHVSIYSFLLWFLLFMFLLLPTGFWSIALVVCVGGTFIWIVTVFSAFGRLIMHSGGMGTKRIFEEDFEKNLYPQSLQIQLAARAREELTKRTSVTRQYRSKSKPVDRDLSVNLGSFEKEEEEEVAPNSRKRADSQVRFADELWSSAPSPPQRSLAKKPTSATTKPATVVGSDTSLTPAKPPSRRQHYTRPPRPETLVAASKSDGDQTITNSERSVEEWLKGTAGELETPGPTQLINNGNDDDNVEQFPNDKDAVPNSNNEPPLPGADQRVSEEKSWLLNSVAQALSQSFELETNLSQEEAERFDHDYGPDESLFDPEDPAMRESPLHHGEQAAESEQQSLLSNGHGLQHVGYSSTSNDDKD